MKRLLALTAALAPILAVTAAADVPTKQLPAQSVTVRLVVKPGEVVRWRSPRIGRVDRLALTIADRGAAYATEPNTRACVAYGYEAGVAVRLTDCVRGRRVPYVRLRAVSAALKPVAVRLRLN